jgi:hypothetical protein
MEIADEAVRPDPDVATRLRCIEQLRTGVEKLHEAAAVGQSDVDGDPWCERTIGADIGLGVEDHDDGRTIVEMGIEVPPFILAPFRADALTVLKLRYFNGGDAKSLVIGGAIRQPKVATLAAIHGYFLLRQSRLLAYASASPRWLYRLASKLRRSVARLVLRIGSRFIVGSTSSCMERPSCRLPTISAAASASRSGRMQPSACPLWT